MASSSVASTSAATSSSFGRLLKSSKVLSQYDPTLPLVYTSHGGSAKRSDFGLKRPLPKLKTPAIRVKQLDSPVTKLTDFDYAAREYTFVKRFQELGVGITGTDTHGGRANQLRSVAEEKGGCHWDSNGFQSIEKLKAMAGAEESKGSRQQQVQKAITGVQSTGKTQGGPNAAASKRVKYLEMTPVQFNQFIRELETLRPQYKEYLRQRLTKGRDQEIGDGLLSQYLRNLAAEGGGALGATIESFLAQHAQQSRTVSSTFTNIKSQPHYQKGLSYAPPTLYQSDVVARPVPGRLVATAAYGNVNKGYNASGKPVVTMGITTRMKEMQLGATSSTSFMLDPQGEYNLEMGRISGGLRVDNVTLREQDPVETRKNMYAPSNTTDNDNVKSADRTLLDEDPILLEIHSAKGDSAFTGFRKIDSRIGSRNWVATSEERPNYSTMSNNVLFRLPDNFDQQGNVKITPPNPNAYKSGSDNIRNQKAKSRAEERAQQGFAKRAKEGEAGGADVAFLLEQLANMKRS